MSDIAGTVTFKFGEFIYLRCRESSGVPPTDVGYDLTDIAITSSICLPGSTTPVANYTVTKGPSQNVPVTAGWYELTLVPGGLQVGRYHFDVRFEPLNGRVWKTKKSVELVITQSETP